MGYFAHYTWASKLNSLKQMFHEVYIFFSAIPMRVIETKNNDNIVIVVILVTET